MHQLIIRGLQSFQRYLLTRSIRVYEVQAPSRCDNRLTSRHPSRGTRGHLDSSRGRNRYLISSHVNSMIVRDSQSRKSSRDHSPIINELSDRIFCLDQRACLVRSFANAIMLSLNYLSTSAKPALATRKGSQNYTIDFRSKSTTNIR